MATTLIIKFDTLAKPRINHKLISWFWNQFFLSHATRVIQQTPDEELKKMLKEGYDELQPIFEQTEKGLEIKESRLYNTGKMQDFVESIPENKDALELIPDV